MTGLYSETAFNTAWAKKDFISNIYIFELNYLSLTGEILNEVTSEPISYSICQRMDEGRNVEHCIALEGH